MSFEFERQITDVFANIDENTLMIAMSVYLALVLLIGALGIVMYVLRSYALCSIAKRRGIRGCGWAWLPIVGVDWIIGKIADQYALKQNGHVKKFAGTLLALTIVGYILILLMYVVLGIWLAKEEGMIFGGANILGTVLPMLFVYAVLGTIALGAAAIVEWVALYLVFDSCIPRKSLRMLLLSFFFGKIALAISLAVCHKKDEGYLAVEAHEREIAKKYLRKLRSREET